MTPSTPLARSPSPITNTDIRASLLQARRVREETVSIPVGSAGEKLPGVLSRGGDRSEKLVIVASGLLTLINTYDVLVNCATDLAANGYDTLRFDFRGIEHSQTGERATVDSEVTDFKAVMAYLNRIGHYRSVAVVAHCLGAAITVLGNVSYSSWNAKEPFGAFVFLSPTFDLRVLQERYREKVERQGYAEVKRVGWLPRVGKSMYGSFSGAPVVEMLPIIAAPTLILYGTKDHITTRNAIEQQFSRLQCEKRLEVLNGADHDFKDPAQAAKVVESVRDWIKTHL